MGVLVDGYVGSSPHRGSCLKWQGADLVPEHPRLGRRGPSPRGCNQAVDIGIGEVNRAEVANVNDSHPAIGGGSERQRFNVGQFSHSYVPGMLRQRGPEFGGVVADKVESHPLSTGCAHTGICSRTT